MKFQLLINANTYFFMFKTFRIYPVNNAQVMCMPYPLGARDTEDTAGLKCRNLTNVVSWVLISRLNSLEKRWGL